MRIIYIIPILLLFSCKSIKFKEMALDSTQEMIGKIKEINANTFNYSIYKKDTTITKINSIAFFDKKNRIIKQIDNYSKFSDETTFNYKNELLGSQLTKSADGTTKIEYKYDQKNNLIEYKMINDTLYYSKTTIYDSRNNPLERTFFLSNSENTNRVEKYDYDYKNRVVKIQSIGGNNSLSNPYLKYYFDKKGFQIKTEFIYPDSNKKHSTSSKNEYDKLGNLTRKTIFDNNGKIINLSEYKNTYDKTGNIIIREQYLNDKLIQKTTNKITYW